MISRIAGSFLVWLVFCGGVAAAETSNAILNTQVCSGYNPLRGNWENIATTPDFRLESFCPEDSAIMAVGFVLGPSRPGENVQVVGRCCPLPKGILFKEHLYASVECPEGFVATGVKSQVGPDLCKAGWEDCKAKWDSASHLLRCSKVDPSRFVLGEASSGKILGFHLMLEPGKESYTSRGRIPLGFRYGVIRSSLYEIEGGGFVGYPWGSLLTGKLGKNQFVFRPLVWKNSPGGEPTVKLYPDCVSLKNELSPYPICVAEDGRESPAITFSDEEMVHRHVSRLLSFFSANVLLKLRYLKGLPTNTSGGELFPKTAIEFSDGRELAKSLEDIIGKSLVIVSQQICANHYESPLSLSCPGGETPLLLIAQKQNFERSLAQLDAQSSKVAQREILFEILRQFQQFGNIYRQLPFFDSENSYLSSHGFLQSGLRIEVIDARSGIIFDSLKESERLLHEELPEELRIPREFL